MRWENWKVPFEPIYNHRRQFTVCCKNCKYMEKEGGRGYLLWKEDKKKYTCSRYLRNVWLLIENIIWINTSFPNKLDRDHFPLFWRGLLAFWLLTKKNVCRTILATLSHIVILGFIVFLPNLRKVLYLAQTTQIVWLVVYLSKHVFWWIVFKHN